MLHTLPIPTQQSHYPLPPNWPNKSKSSFHDFQTFSYWHLESSPPNIVQIVLSTAHPAKFLEAVESALKGYSEFDFDRDVLPEEFVGLLSMPQRVVDVWNVDAERVKGIIAKTAVRDVEFAAAVAAAHNAAQSVV